jgi:hypothetical protein
VKIGFEAISDEINFAAMLLIGITGRIPEARLPGLSSGENLPQQNAENAKERTASFLRVSEFAQRRSLCHFEN